MRRMHSVPATPPQRPRILVVEDESIVALDIQQQLEQLGYQVVGRSPCAEEAIALANALRPDLVLMDIQLAGTMDGITAAQEIRPRLGIPVVFLTAFEADELLARAQLTEPFGYILKPFSSRELRTVLEMALYRSRSEARLRASEQQFRTIFEAEPSSVQVLDGGGYIQQINAAGLQMLGASELSELQLAPFVQLILPSYRDAFVALHQRVLRGESGVLEFEIQTLHGTLRWMDAHAGPLPDINHQGPAMLCVIRDITERQQAQAVQQDHLQQLQGLSRRVLAAQETERRRVAHELHDELGQYLTAIKINLQTSLQGSADAMGARMAENIGIVEEAIQQVRRLAAALRPSVLDDLGLVPALKWMAEQNAVRGAIEIHFQSAIFEVRLLPEIETACFRIAQEALTNILRHAGCSRVDIRLFVEVDNLVLTINDNGRGFDVAAATERAHAGGSLGVIGMLERATLIGGELTLESTLGRGSSLRLSCPLQVLESGA